MKSPMRNASIRYRIMAYVVGTLLVVLVCVGLPLKYLGGNPHVVTWTAIPHGYLYMILLITAVDLGLKAKWSWKRLILIALAGTVLLCTFVAERSATKDVRAKLAQAEAAEPAPTSSLKNLGRPPEYRFVDILRPHRVALDEGNDALQVVNRGELDDDLALGSAQVDPNPGVEVIGEPIGEILTFGATVSGCRCRRAG